jgi:predicted aminopeptidase
VRIPEFGIRILRAAALVGLCSSLSACYYVQAVRGQFEVMHRSEAIAAVIDAGDTPAKLAERLRLVEAARQFSIRELHLPDNDSYRKYADIERDYVVWNVFAAPEFSLEPQRWCFPIAGCVAYRGYFAEESARRKAARLRAAGNDVAVGGVAAYSTLGKMSDPVLSSMMRWSDVDLVAVIFHELAHQVLYVKGDTGFNESFATTVEEFGIERWLHSRGEDDALAAYRQRQATRARLLELVAAARAELETIYAADTKVGVMRDRKLARLQRLSDDIDAVLAASGGDRSVWSGGAINNATLASLTLYTGRTEEFRMLLQECGGDVDCFYDAARKLAKNR